MERTTYCLMHKDLAVCELAANPLLGGIVSVSQIYEPDHLPVGTPSDPGRPEIISSLRSWWKGRAIPLDRDGLSESLPALRADNYDEFLLCSLGLSLSDCYWIYPKEIEKEAGCQTDPAGISWANVNFYDNAFPEYVGEAMMYGNHSDIPYAGKGSSYSPDSMLYGTLGKRWIIDPDEKRVLVKSATPPYYQQAFNEEIASRIAKLLGFNHVMYSLGVDGKDPKKAPSSFCECFTSQDIEFVPASLLTSISRSRSDLSPYDRFLYSCRRLQIQNVDKIIHGLDEMIVLDYLIINTDRHWNNFGLLRNPETLECLGAAPIFDCGASLLFDQRENMFDQACYAPCRPFCGTFEEQIKLLHKPDKIDLSSLSEQIIEEICWSVFAKFDDTRYEISNLRSDLIVDLIRERKKSLQKYLARRRHVWGRLAVASDNSREAQSTEGEIAGGSRAEI